MIMAELDPSPKMPLAPLEAARIDKVASAEAWLHRSAREGG